MQKVIFLYGDSLGNVYEYAGRALKGAFEALQYELVPLRMARTPQFFATLDDLFESEPAFAFGFAGAGHSLTVDPDDFESASLWEFMQVPHLSFYGDSPAYAFDFHRQRGSFSASLYGYDEHLELRRQLPSIRGVLGRAYPFGFEPSALQDIDLEAKKRGKILFLKNGNDPAELELFWRKSLNPGTVKHLFTLKEIVDSDLGQGIDRPVQDTVSKYLAGFGLVALESSALLLLLIAQIDDYLRRIKSTLLTDTLLDYPVEVWGRNWGHVRAAGRRGKIIDRCDVASSNRAMRQEALCIVDMSPNTQSSYHDRQIRAADAMTLCLSNQQTFLDAASEYASSFTFRFTRDGIAERVSKVLADPQSAVQMGVKVSEEFRSKFDIASELSRWCEIADLVKTNGMSLPPANAPPYFVWPPALG